MSRGLTVVGCGYTGRRILQRLPGAIGISRSQPPGIEDQRFLQRDLDDAIAPIAVSGAVIYTVAPDASGTRLQRFLDALETPPSRIVYLSTSGVYGDRQGGTVVETDAVNPETERAKRRVAAEAQLAAYRSELVVLRVPGIYGPGRLGVERLRHGDPVVSDADATPGNRIHVDDLVNICIRAAEADAPTGVFNLGDGDHRSSTAFVREVARQAGLPKVSEISLEEAKATFSPMRLSFMTESRVVDTTKLATLGVRLKYPSFEDGIRASL